MTIAHYYCTTNILKMPQLKQYKNVFLNYIENQKIFNMYLAVEAGDFQN